MHSKESQNKPKNRINPFLSLLIGGALFLFPFVVDASSVGTFFHILWADKPGSSQTVTSSSEDGSDILNVTDSIYVEGSVSSFAKTQDCSIPAGDTQDIIHKSFWTELTRIRVEYRVDGGSWQNLNFSESAPTPTELFDDCRDDPFRPWRATYSMNVDTSHLPEDQSWHTLEVRSVSENASQGNQEFRKITYDFQMAGTQSPPPSGGEPDLEADDAALADPPSAQVGEDTVFDFSATNIGNAGTGSSFNFVCRLNGTQFDSGTMSALSAGETDWSYCQENNIGPAGDYTFQVCLDTNNNISESNENNNCDSFSFTVTDPNSPGSNLPDLDVVSGPSISSGQPDPGEDIKFSATYQNIGNSGAGNSKVRFWVDGSPIYTTNLGSMSAGQSKTKTTSNWTATQGVHTVKTCADYQDVVSESNENNNCDSNQISIGGPLPSSQDDAEVFDENIPTVFEPDESKPISVSIRNTGETWWYHGTAYRFLRTDDSPFVLDCGGLNYIHIPQTIHSVSSGHNPNNFSANCTLTAPSTAGTYTFSMRMRHTSEWNWREEPSHNSTGESPNDHLFFGETLSRTITVEDAPSSDIDVSATLDGEDWTGSTDYRILGPNTINGSNITSAVEHEDVSSGTWTIDYQSGGPAGAEFSNVTGGDTKTVGDDEQIEFELNFVSEGDPDLVTSSLSARNIDTGATGNSFVEGDRLRFDATILNQGDAGTGSGFEVRFTRSGNLVSDENSGSLGAGESGNETSNTWNATPGSWTIRACADNDDDVTESNESNNCRTIIIDVSEETECNDGADNDGDGFIDLNDPQCDDSDDDSESTPPQCDDGVDNDDDGWIDLDDPSCQNKNDDNEGDGDGDTQCSDGIDNDGDGLVDGNDPECSSSEDNTEAAIQFEEF